jgi:predicted ATPase/class 3 adenylate cyclase
MPDLPMGTVTFLLTDVEGSTRLWEDAPDAMEKAVARHDELMAAIVEANGGVLLKHKGEGDSTFCVFHRATDAIAAALASQRALASEGWSTPTPIRVRAGLHSGEAELRDNDYYGQTVNRCARLRSIGYGGQVLLSQTTADLVRDVLPDGSSLRDLGPQRLKDLARAEQVFQLCHPDISEEFPALRSLDRLPNNLPIQLTSFVGREREVDEVAELLSKTRLLTLTGAGGCGKTRLALHVAADVLDAYADGVWVADLAAVTDPDGVLRQVAAAVGVREEGTGGVGSIGGDAAGQTTALNDRLINSLRSRRLLLVMDNCEHLVAACAQVADILLRACPELHVIVTTREPLGVAGEVAWRVPSLGTPDPKHVPEPDELARFEAVKLFCDRAEAARPGFVLTPEDGEAVALICHRLDGIPLAVELAAAKVHALTTKQIAERLGNRFRLLTGGSRTALARQQTLRALVDWSHELLDDNERALLRRLSVFSGGFTLEAAEELCASGDVETEDVLELVMSLVRKSLVQMDELESGARYRLLETIRQYAREKLLESGEVEELRARHREYFLRLAEAAEPELRRHEQAQWLETLELEHDNLRSAIEWSLDEPNGAEAALRLAGSLRGFWDTRGHLTEGRRWTESALAVDGAASPGARAKALKGAGALAGGLGDNDTARRYLDESLVLYRELDDRGAICDVLRITGFVAANTGDHETQGRLTQEALELAREIGDGGRTALCLNNLGVVAVSRGDWTTARPLMTEALGLLREAGDMAYAITPLRNLGLFASLLDGDKDTARSQFEEALEIARRIGAKADTLSCLHSLGDLAAAEDDYGLARSLFEQALTVAREVGIKGWMGSPLDGLGDVAMAVGEYEEARAFKEEYVAIRREIGEDPETAVALFNVGWVHGFEGDWTGAEAKFEESLALFGEDSLMRWVPYAGLAYVALSTGDLDNARAQAEASLECARKMGVPTVVGLALRTLGTVLCERGELTAAREALRESLELLSRAISRGQVVLNIEAIASLAASEGDSERAARLFGAADSHRKAIGFVYPPGLLQLQAPSVERTRTALGDTAFETAWSDGGSMSFEDAVTYALDSESA